LIKAWIAFPINAGASATKEDDCVSNAKDFVSEE
jgi:hypothetical protein